MAKVLMKGNEAIGAAAIKAGCKFFFGYPITPQSELPEYMAREMPKAGATFLQAESEVAAINMVYGAAGAGARVMTSSSSPGISLKQEGISYIAGAELPCVIVNIIRGGPGLGGIQPAQSDYFQATKGGGHGDYKMVVLAPASVQELTDLLMEGFDIADQYRNPVMIIGDGMLGQMMEPVELREPKKRNLPPKDWATTGTGGRGHTNVINSLFIDPAECEKHNLKLKAKFDEMEKNEKKYEIYNCDNPDIIVAAYGTTSRIVKTAIDKCKDEGINVGLIRPISLWPFPYEVFEEYADRAKAFLSVEMSLGQMVEDVKLGVNGKKPVYFYGRTGGMVPVPDDIVAEIKKILGGAK
ncbi:MAG: 3-methyl-2-oxobutanoate dehydrogenase subunit VorB [Clostridiales bacterium]|jgi:2-oxoglutarate ferredoxin oxidoreductase subunit alpha|nr:3-methyl-2-oxobutanoate dehydrogenase subunit VorB [Clostridiales bacterium]HQA48303.1 3-methyl-2-oxobutanoate dehydrogenase subunit VorB [Bacillota bacterium]HQD41679.1 3-methyl-2-oxobutanoate dehydrogenase subunit VorB [Bacillota bacterium]